MSDGQYRALSTPRPADVRQGEDGVPLAVNGRRIESVRESWLVEDRWWTEQPLSRRYWELLSVDGRNLILYHDLHSGRWFAHRS
jgi:hypothetical protein